MEDKTTMQKQVYDVLVTPIICDKKLKENSFIRKNGVIFSSQKYCRDADPDMSDLAINFYQILYKDKLIDFNLIDENGYLTNKEFAGDTMNSYNTIANGIASTKLQFIGDENNVSIDPYLTYYKNHYHCLANFWLIPMRHGRQSPKKNRYDSLDLYLQYINENWENLKNNKQISYGRGKYITTYDNYFENTNLKDFKDFCRIHYIEKINDDILDLYKNHQYNDIMDIAISSIFDRAKNIASDIEICPELYKFFEERGILDSNR